MSVDPLEETLEATVSPVQVNPFGNTQAQDHVVLRPLSHKKIVILQNIIGLKEKRCGEKNEHDSAICTLWLLRRLNKDPVQAGATFTNTAAIEKDTHQILLLLSETIWLTNGVEM